MTHVTLPRDLVERLLAADAEALARMKAAGIPHQATPEMDALRQALAPAPEIDLKPSKEALEQLDRLQRAQAEAAASVQNMLVGASAPQGGGEAQLIEERDRASDMADKLAAMIADALDVDIGEHTNFNCPWTEALSYAPTLKSALQAPSEAPQGGGDRDEAVRDLAKQFASSIASLGYPVGLGVAPPEEACMKAAEGIIDIYGPRLAALQAPGEAGEPVAWLVTSKIDGKRQARLHRPHPGHGERLKSEALYTHPPADRGIDPRLIEWGYTSTDEAITALGKLLADQAAFDGLAPAPEGA